MMFTLDTNILIYYAAGDEHVASFLRDNGNKIFYIPTIVIAEFLSHPLMDERTQALFRLFLSQTTAIGLDTALAERAAIIRRVHKLKLADAVIAATALFTGSTLITRNEKDFRKVLGLGIINP